MTVQPSRFSTLTPGSEPLEACLSPVLAPDEEPLTPLPVSEAVGLPSLSVVAVGLPSLLLPEERPTVSAADWATLVAVPATELAALPAASVQVPAPPALAVSSATLPVCWERSQLGIRNAHEGERTWPEDNLVAMVRRATMKTTKTMKSTKVAMETLGDGVRGEL